MKEITREEIIKKVVGYEAFDGTRFDDKKECQKYEASAFGVMKARYQKLVVGELSEYELFNGYAGCEDYHLEIVSIKTRDDATIVSMFVNMFTKSKESFDDYVGKDIIIGHYYTDKEHYMVGTIDKIINGIRQNYENAKKGAKENA